MIEGPGPRGFGATWCPGDLDVELSDPFKANTIRLQFAAFIPAVETMAPVAGFLPPQGSEEGALITIFIADKMRRRLPE